MKKRILEASAASVVLLIASASLAATTAEPGSCDGGDGRNTSAGGASPCIKVAIRSEPEGLRPAVMRAVLVTPAKVEVRQPAQEDRLPQPGGWSMLLAGLLGALAIARRRVS